MSSFSNTNSTTSNNTTNFLNNSYSMLQKNSGYKSASALNATSSVQAIGVPNDVMMRGLSPNFFPKGYPSIPMNNNQNGNPPDMFSNPLLFPKGKDFMDSSLPFNVSMPSTQYQQSAPTISKGRNSLNDEPLNFNDQKEQQEHDKSEPIIFVPSKIPKSLVSNDNNNNNNNIGPFVYNEYSSCTITQHNQKTILNDMADLLNNYSNEIEYNIDNNRNEIEGTIYIRHRPISWLVSIWSENDVTSRVEFQKRHGDCIDFQKFWSEILEKIHEKFDTKNVSNAQRCQNFGDLFLPSFDFVEEMECTNEQLDEFDDQLRDDYHEIAVDALGLLCTRLEKEVKTSKLAANHKKLMETLTSTILNHFDCGHVRGALHALQMIAKASENGVEQLLDDRKILDTVIPLLQHQQTLIRKHAIRLLAALSGKEWRLTDAGRSDVKKQLLKLQKEWHIDDKSNDFVSSDMFNRIQNRLQKVSSSSSTCYPQ